MNIGVLGTGDVGRTIASRLVEVGHTVKLGSRSADNEKSVGWAKENGERASAGTFNDAASFGEVVFNCTKGEHSLAALALAGADALGSKVLVDVSNPLDFSRGFPPRLDPVNDDSMAEEIQRTYPKARVVKALNTMWNGLMVRPRLIAESHHTFLSGNDADAKGVVRGILESFGWRAEEMIDLGDITTARGTEMYLALWTRLYAATQNGAFNIRLVSVPAP